MFEEQFLAKFRIDGGRKVRLSDYDTGWKLSEEIAYFQKDEVKDKAKDILEKNREDLARGQSLLWANNTYSLLIIIQGMDTSGKDSLIKHVMSGINPQGCRVSSFGVPSKEELDHDYFWRCNRRLPARGEIGIFNRSYYEEVLITKVHPEILDARNLPQKKFDKEFWKMRYEDMNSYERRLLNSGTCVLKFFLHISKEKQKERLLARFQNESKYWKISPSDIVERKSWDKYIEAYEDMLENTSTKAAPWYVIPADYKWVARTLVSDIIASKLISLHDSYPQVSEERLDKIKKAIDLLKDE
jgi:PPK2 family polyphosphate:nucleotide phosphotransferase